MGRVMEMVARVAATDSTVLLTGESGTGKGLVAHQIHQLSRRARRPFITVDCGTLVETLFESELFGHVKGAFTGADANKIGKFELAQHGTLFFDEISNISLEVQAKLLRAVEERKVCKVGSHRVITVDVRIIAATNKDLTQAIQEGTFRGDLFYRLNVVNLHLPLCGSARRTFPSWPGISWPNTPSACASPSRGSRRKSWRSWCSMTGRETSGSWKTPLSAWWC